MTNYPKLEECIKTIFKLRDPENGCPWDLKQTHESLLKYLIEESYEFIDSVERKNKDDMKDELGDVLLQVLLHSKIAEENKSFSLEDVAKNLTEKIIERHPHVFGETKDSNLTPEQVEENWKEIKNKNKEEKRSVFSQKDLCLPSLLSSFEIGKKTTSNNFDWSDYSQVVYKVEEEWQELKEELTPNRKIDLEKVEEEMGDLLFSMAQLARHVDIDPEVALRKANQKFIRRFQGMENLVRKDGRELKDFDQMELDEYWSQVKSYEK